MTKFYEELENANKQCKSQDIIYVMGDFDAKIGNERIGNTVGRFSLSDKNDRGDNVISWCQSHDLVITNTWFKNHPRRLCIWRCPGDRTRNQIDHIMAPHCFRNCIISSKAFLGADCGSDHVPVIRDIRIKPKRVRSTLKNMKLQIHLPKNDLNIKDKFRIEVQNRFEALNEINETTITDILWEQLKLTITRSAEKKDETDQ